MMWNEVQSLRDFYNVETDLALIEAMNRHIEKLQTKLAKHEKPQSARIVAREG